MQTPGIHSGLKLANEIVNFFCFSKRASILKKFTSEKLHKFCNTRWNEQAESLVSVIDNLGAIVNALESMVKDNISGAQELLWKIRAPEAVLPLIAGHKISSLLNPLVILLQRPDMDVSKALNLINLTIEALENVKESQEAWNRIYSQYLGISTEIGSFLNRESLIDKIVYQKRLRKELFIEPI